MDHPDSRKPPAVGTRFGRFEILSRLGAGAMGEVYRARDHDLNRDVAVKFLPPRFTSDTERLRRFVTEARAASSLNHPNIVTIHEVGEAEGCPYIVMEYVEGETLRALMHTGRQPARKILEIASQIAEGLSKAHSAGIVHRDLKPDNVMVTKDGFVKILDFGLAKLKVDLPGQDWQAPDKDSETVPAGWTSQGAILGSVGYMSPEQAAGKAADFRADQFGLGAILYEMASGQRAFRRDTAAQTLAAIIEEEPTPLAELNAAFPAPARWIIERCLAKDPGGRYASTLDLARELRGVREHLSETSASKPALEAIPSPGRWKWALIALIMTAILFFLPTFKDFLLEKVGRTPLPAEKRLAVLPIRHPGGTAEDGATCEGLQSYLVARLAELERFHDALRVVPAIEVRRAGVTADSDVSRVLSATLALDITVQRLEGSTVISASLFDAGRRQVLRAVTRKIGGDTSLLDETVDAVVGMLDIELGAEERRILRAGASSVAMASALYAQGLSRQPYEQARTAVEQANTALERYEQQGKLEEAVMLFNAALKSDPRFALAHAGLAEAYLRLWGATRNTEYRDLAEKHSQRALEMDPLIAEVWLTLGSLHAQAGKGDEALADFDRAQARAPLNPDIIRERAVALERLKRFSEAESSYQAAIKMRRDSWSTLNYYANFLGRQGRFKEAEASLRKALEIVPDNARVWSNLGVILYNSGRSDEAESAWKKSVSLQPNAAAISNLASREFYKERYAEAARGYQEAVKLRPLDYRIRHSLAAAFLYQPQEKARAIEEYRKSFQLAEREHQLDPQNALPLATMAESQVQIGDAALARKLIGEAVKLGPKSWFLASRAAGVYEELGDREAALRWLDAAFRAGYSPAQAEKSPTFRRLREDPRYARIRAQSDKKPVSK